MVPLGTLVKLTDSSSARTQISGNVAAWNIRTSATGASTGQAIEAMEDVAKKTLPPGYSYSGRSGAQAVKSAASRNSDLHLALHYRSSFPTAR